MAVKKKKVNKRIQGANRTWFGMLKYFKSKFIIRETKFRLYKKNDEISAYVWEGDLDANGTLY